MGLRTTRTTRTTKITRSSTPTTPAVATSPHLLAVLLRLRYVRLYLMLIMFLLSYDITIFLIILNFPAFLWFFFFPSPLIDINSRHNSYISSSKPRVRQNCVRFLSLCLLLIRCFPQSARVATPTVALPSRRRPLPVLSSHLTLQVRMVLAPSSLSLSRSSFSLSLSLLFSQNPLHLGNFVTFLLMVI